MHQCCSCSIVKFWVAGGKSGRQHRTLIDVIQDLEQENAEEEVSTGLSPANERPVPLDLSCAISDPETTISAGTQDVPDQQSHPVQRPTEAALNGDHQSIPSLPGQNNACRTNK